jgi:hypothetical protein
LYVLALGGTLFTVIVAPTSDDRGRACLTEKLVQGPAGLWNISFGFLGIQIGFALQNANMSRISRHWAARSTTCPIFGLPRR